MFVAFVESIKYVGHLLPIAFLRIFVGYFYFNQALLYLHNDFLTHAYLAEDIRAYLPHSSSPEWYRSLTETVIISNWQIFAYLITIFYLLIGLSYILGYMVRTFALIGVFLALNLILALGPHQSELSTTMILVVHLTIGWLGAGRCLGIDYYFFKRRRGIWW